MQLKTASKEFVNKVAQSSEKNLHKVSIVTFSGRVSRNPEQTKVVKPLSPCDKSNVKSFINEIDKLEANGATRSDLGLDLACSQMKVASEDKDRNSNKIVVFFSDGKPKDYYNKEKMPNEEKELRSEVVVQRAIDKAYILKNEYNAKIYTVGMFNENDAVDKIVDDHMKGVSSNYKNAHSIDDAEKFYELGEADPSGKYYKLVDNQNLSEIFNEILKEIKSNTGYSTKIEGDPATSGYVTITDTLGDFMEVKSIDGIIYNGMQYVPGADDTFDQEVTTSTNEKANLKDIVITKSFDATTNKNSIEVKVPAILLPTIVASVEQDASGNVKGSLAKTTPIRILYSVGLNDKAKTELAKNDLSDPKLAAYVKDNTDTDGKIRFYSNDWGRNDSSAKTLTTFVPADNNEFYSYTKAVELLDENGNQIDFEKVVNGNVYQVKKTFYKINDNGGTATLETTYYPALIIDKDKECNKVNGKAVIVEGTHRDKHVEGVENPKGKNATGTCPMIIDPEWKNNQVEVPLGNNGLLKYSLPSNLTITKKVVNDISPEYNTTEDFEFTINLKDKAGQALTGEFNAELLDAAGKVVEGNTPIVVTDGSVVNIKSGQSLVVKGLPDGTQYTVTETAKDYYDTTIKVDGIEYPNAGSNVVTGNTKSGTDQKVEYTNKYKITKPATLETTIKPEVVKNIKGRTFKVGDKFRFVLQEETTENPQITEAVIDVTKDSVLVGKNTATVHFDNDLTFDKPGTYKYTIKEYNDNAVGIDYSNALYSYEVTVTDNNNGTLTAKAILKKVKDDNGTNLDPMTTVDKAEFTNDFSLTKCDVALKVNKEYINNSDTPVAFGKFEFEISAESGVPMPETAVTDGTIQKAVIKNDANTTSFPSISYTEEGTYNYTIKEIIPKGVDENNVLNGIKYDSTEHNITVEVTAVKATESTGDYLKAVVKDATGEELKDNTVKFTNTYDVVSTVIGGDDPANAAFDIRKTIDGRNFDALDSFDFELKADANNSEGAIILADTATISGSGVNGNVAHGKIGKIKFTRAGVYKFTINEKAVDKAGFTLATNTEEVTVTVTDNHKGTLSAVTDYGLDKLSATFTNTYKSTGNTDDILDPDPDPNPDPDPANKKNGIRVTKQLTGRDWFEGDNFEFTIAPDLSHADTKAAVDGGRIKMPSNTKLVLNKNNQNGKFEPIEFTTPNMKGDVAEYHFIVTETDTNIKGVKYADPQIVVVKVKDNKNGTLEVTSDNHLLTFVNSYTPDPIDIGKKDPDPKPDPDKPEPPVDPNNPNTEDSTKPNNYIPLMAYKELNGRPLRDGEFTFTLTAVTVGAPMPEDAVDGKVTASNKNGIVQFGNITYDVNHAGNTYEYKIEETTAAANGITPDSETINVKVNVKNDKTLGKLVPTVTYEKGTKAAESKVQTFVNNYKPGNAAVDASTNLIVKKTYKGKQWNGETFRFTLTNISDAAIKDNVVSGGNQTLDITHTATDTDVIDGLKTSTTEEKAFAENIVFNKVGTYKFQIKEEVPAEPIEGTIVNDTKTYDITVKVTDDGNGVLKATVIKPAELTDGKLSFTNTYEPEDIVVGGKDPKPDPDQDPDSDTKIPDPDSKPDPDPDKYDPDTDPNKEDDNKPNCYLPIAAEKVMVGRSLNATDKFEFTLKAVTEGAPMHKNADNTVLTKDVVVNDFKRVLFKDIVFGTESIDKEYKYEITETAKSANGVISDYGKVIVTVSIKYDAAKGKLIPTVSYAKTPETEGYKSNAFINEYKPNVPGILDGATHLNVTKRYKGKNWTKEKFTFKLELAKGDAANVQFTNNELTIDGTTDLSNATVTGEDLDVVTKVNKAFGDITFTGKGQYIFHITEVVPDPKDSHITYDESVREIVVNVKDNGVGGYVAEIVKADNCVFNNTYTPDPIDIGGKDPDPSNPDVDPDPNVPDPDNKNAYIPLMAKKVMNGRELKATDKFEFTLSAPEGTPMPEVTTVINDGSAIICKRTIVGATL